MCPTSDSEPTVVATGFGLFRNYKVNPSWECVKRLRLDGIKLIVEQIPVAYEEVDRRVEQIWSQYKPSLVIHCGVSSLAKCITLESRAVRQKQLFVKPDIYGKLPNCPQSKSRSEEGVDKCDDCITCAINLDKVAKHVNQQCGAGAVAMGAEVSTNAGRFLCEYIFHSSLLKNNERTAFIHVPEISDNCSIEDITSALQLTIETLIKEVLETNRSPNDL